MVEGNTLESKVYRKQRIRVIVITGSPGVGKTAVSKALADKLGMSYVSLTDIVKDENLVLGVDGKRDTLIADLEKLSKRVEKAIRNSSKDLIVEGHYASDVVPSSLASYVFVLRCDPDDLRIRLEGRGYKEKKVLENVESEALDVCLVNAIERYSAKKADEIDTTHMTVNDVVDEIIQVLNGQKPMKVGKVDWLGKMEEEGRLEKFLNQLNWL